MAPSVIFRGGRSRGAGHGRHRHRDEPLLGAEAPGLWSVPNQAKRNTRGLPNGKDRPKAVSVCCSDGLAEGGGESSDDGGLVAATSRQENQTTQSQHKAGQSRSDDRTRHRGGRRKTTKRVVSLR